MPTIAAICLQTLRANLRLRVFHLLAGLVLLVAAGIPLTAAGDGTAVGEAQMILTYTLGLLAFLLSAATLWIGCTALSRDIEGYQIHLVQNSAATRTRIWLGKWLGVFLPHAALLLLGLAVMAGLLHWKMARRWTYSAAELERARNEVLTGRREYRPELPDFPALALAEYDRRRAAGELSPDHQPAAVKAELLRLIRARATELPPGALRPWQFQGVRAAPPGTRLQLRYRLYLGDRLRSSQRLTAGEWAVKIPDTEEARFLPWRALSGSFQEFAIPAEFVDRQGQLAIAYRNADPGGSAALFQEGDGPFLYAPATGFLPNLGRAALLLLLQLAFLAALGVTLSGLLSTPVAMFVAVSYLLLGLTVQQVVTAPAKNEFGAGEYSGVGDRLSQGVARAVELALVSVGDFNPTPDLIHGRLITGAKLGRVTGNLLLLRTLPLALLGIWLFNRRELGLVIRTS
ncbi:MAG: hypothetical protein WC789_00520 [Lentisphaeria bacterium]|jgi:hypothetical protein